MAEEPVTDVFVLDDFSQWVGNSSVGTDRPLAQRGNHVDTSEFRGTGDDCFLHPPHPA